MSKQSRLNKEKAARAKASQENRQNPQPQLSDAQRVQQQRNEGAERARDKRTPN